METVRFTKIVEEAGQPEPYTLWLPPEKDKQFQAAIKAHRVMTVHQENTGTATDFGEIGFEEGVQGSFLLFPKSLKRYEGKRVVGIKYDLLQQPPPAAAPAAKQKREPKRAVRAEPEPKPEAEPKPEPENKAQPKPEPKPKALKTPPSLAPKFEALRIFEPQPGKEPPKVAEPSEPADAGDQSGQSSALTREVRKAMKKLEQGNPVAAYKILEKALS